MGTVRLNLLMGVLVLILLFMQYRLWFEPGGLRDFWQLKKALALQSEQMQNLKKTNEELFFHIERLRHSREEAESRARSDLGMIKNDEEFYQLVR